MSEVVTPLELPGWLAFNEWRTGLQALEFSTAAAQDGAHARAVLYVDRRGRVRLPPNNPYLSVVFRSARSRPSGRTSEWLKAAMPLAEEMGRRRTVNLIWLPPDVDDVRPWRWAGFQVRVGYTYQLGIPLDPGSMDRGSRRAIERAAAGGLSVERVDEVAPVLECLLATEARKGFSHGIRERELQKARELLGPDSLRMYVCRDPRGRAAAARVVLCVPGGHAIAWLAGTRSEHLTGGANQLLFSHVVDDLVSARVSSVDYGGASIPAVARAKSQWGGRLAPTYGVRTRSLRAGARFAADWLHAWRGPGAG